MSISKSKSLLELAELVHKIKESYLICRDVDLQTCRTVPWEKFWDLFIDGFQSFIKNTKQAVDRAGKIDWPEQKLTLKFLLKLRERAEFTLDEMKLKRQVKLSIPDNCCEGGFALAQINLIVHQTGLRQYISQLDEYYSSIESEGKFESLRNIGEQTDKAGDTAKKHENPKLQPLTKKAGLIYKKLCALQPHEAMTLPDIQTWLYNKHKIDLDEGTWKDIRKELIPYGLKNRPRVGYYIEKK